MTLEGVKKFGDIIETEKSFLFGSLASMFSDDLLRGTTVIEKQTVYYVMKVSGLNQHLPFNMGYLVLVIIIIHAMMFSNDMIAK